MSSGTRSKTRMASANKTARTPFLASRNSKASHNVLSALFGPHSVGEGIVGFLTEEEKKILRLVNPGFKEAVNVSEEFGYINKPIKGSLEAWRRKFPKAK